MAEESGPLTVVIAPRIEEAGPLTVVIAPKLTGAQPDDAGVPEVVAVAGEGVVTDRVLETLPWYYRENELLVSLARAFEAESERFLAFGHAMRDDAIPSTASDTTGLLSEWEALLELPVAPPDAGVDQRRAKVMGAIAAVGAGEASQTLETLRAAAGTANITVTVNSPRMLVDTIHHPFGVGSYNATVLGAVARRLWPAHRGVILAGIGGFVLDVSHLDVDVLA